MTGKILVSSIFLASVIFGGAIYYLQVYAYYREVPAAELPPVELIALATGLPEAIEVSGVSAIDSDSSPLRFRSCFTLEDDAASLAETYQPYANADPLNAPGWFDCFNAREIGLALEAGQAKAYLSEPDFVYGFDRVIAVFPDGRGFVWPQLNPCGKEFFDTGTAPDGCPPAPERN